MKKHHRPAATTENTPDLATVALPKGRFWLTIPAAENFTPEERALFESGRYPFTVCEHTPEHETFLDFLVEQGVAEWCRDLDASAAGSSDDSKGDR
ncbi:MAG: hypothetical protein IPM79_37700 [Polyangiaceae bacterium]|nr:hypothetical protein [Polyangiaceae bacterium]MBK8943184.1 hypothetical protein [Polyangiaceae bacterium]